MFTQEFMREVEKAFAEQMNRLQNRKTQVEEVLKGCTDDEAEALKCLYVSMPVSDGADYSPQLYLDYAKHGAFLWKEGPFAGQVPEDIFAGYVLHHRVNNEDMVECRPFFYEKLKDRIRGMGMREAILEINYWCAEEATYRTTDGRTASAASVYRSAYGRCGEESTFAVSVLRSMGIPARQVYVPLWSHCDDNHAWVEVWCEGSWKFLGACEPEEVLNKGWFTNASSRAMMVHSRWLLPSLPKEELVGRRGMSLVVNQLKTYAKTTELEVLVQDANGKPAAGAQISFEVMNYACFGEIARVKAGENGKKVLETGLGTVQVTASKDGAYGEVLVDAGKQKSCIVKLGERKAEDVWTEMILTAPKDSPVNRCVQSEKEIQKGRKRLKESAEIRRKKEQNFFNEELAQSVVQKIPEEFRSRGMEIMRLARGNQKEIAAFLACDTRGRWQESRKIDVLNSLREKDYLDITADILEEHCAQAAAYEGKWEDAVYVPYILCPRVENEMIRPFRSFLNTWLTEEEKRQITQQPELVWKMLGERLISDERLEYGNLITSAEGALTSGFGSFLTRRVVAVQILRTLGIPARLSPSDQILEMWKDEIFVALEEKQGQSGARTAAICMQRQEGENWTYFQNWTISRLEEKGYQTLQLCDESGEEIYGEIPLFSGTYKLLTSNRLPNGNIFAKQMIFQLKEGEKKEIVLEQMEAQVTDMLEDNDLPDFSMKTEDGTSFRISELVKEKKGLFIWLEEGKEPTEHILNEMYQRKDAYNQLDANIYFVVSGMDVKKDPTLKRTLSALTNVQFLVDDFGADMEVWARRMYLEPGKLPLIVIADEKMKGIYGVAGYNVGTADMILKILDL